MKELEEELHVVTNNLRSLEINEDKVSMSDSVSVPIHIHLCFVDAGSRNAVINPVENASSARPHANFLIA